MERDRQLLCLLALGLVAPPAAWCLNRDPIILMSVVLSSLVAYMGYRWTVYLIPLLAPRHAKAGLVGKDINKKGTEAGDRPVPESLGLAPGVVALVCLASIQLLHKFQVRTFGTRTAS